MTELLISIKKGSKVFIENGVVNKVLSEINLDVFCEETVAIMGSSGSGKSTLLNVISLIEILDSGSYHLKGKEVINLTNKEKSKLLREYIAIVNQSYEVFDFLTIYENIKLVYAINSLPIDQEKIELILKRLNLYKYRNSYPRVLSGGQLQKVNIARVLCKIPKLLLLDEPTASLDYKSSIEVIKLLNEIKCTKICMTHNPKVACIFDRVLFLVNGKIKHEIWKLDEESTEDYQERIVELSMKGMR